MKKLLLLSAILLTGCVCDNDDAECKVARAAYCQPKVISQTEDGTKLYSIDHRCPDTHGRQVFFSKGGTQHEENCGKGCSRPEIVPEQ